MKNCIFCSKFRLYNLEAMIALPNDSVPVTRFSCAANRFAAVHLKTEDELRALTSQASFCPKFKPLSGA